MDPNCHWGKRFWCPENALELKRDHQDSEKDLVILSGAKHLSIFFHLRVSEIEVEFFAEHVDALIDEEIHGDDASPNPIIMSAIGGLEVTEIGAALICPTSTGSNVPRFIIFGIGISHNVIRVIVGHTNSGLSIHGVDPVDDIGNSFDVISFGEISHDVASFWNSETISSEIISVVSRILIDA